MTRRPCLVPGCSKWAETKGRCVIHSKDQERDERDLERLRLGPGRIYSRKRWLILRRRVLHNEPLCRQCGNIATEVDHIVPISEGGAEWAVANLQSLCGPCHAAKTARELAGQQRKGTHG